MAAASQRRTRPLLLGVDIGTTHLKMAAYDDELNEVRSSSSMTPAPLRGAKGQLDALGLWITARQQLEEMIAGLDGDRVAAIGISGMAETGCLIGPDGRPLTPMLLWHDSAGTRQAAAWREKAGAEFLRTTGLRMTNVRSLAKWRWLVDLGAPKNARWCGAPEWIALWLTGNWVTDSTLAVRTGALDVLADSYSSELLHLAGAPAGLFPPVGGSPAVAGPLLSDVGSKLGIHSPVTVVVAGHDDIVAAFGAGGGRGDLIDSAGTAEGLIQVSEATPDPALSADAGVAISKYYLNGTWALVSGAGATGALMERVAEMLGADFAELDRSAAPPGEYSAGILKVRLSEKGLPHVVINSQASPDEIWSAALDLVCERMGRAASRLERIGGRAARAILVGGAAKSGELVRRKTVRLGMPTLSLPQVDATTRGAAALAGRSAGVR